jgi:hypothetical protein
MQVTFLRLGMLGVKEHVGFLCNDKGEISAFETVQKALNHVDYKSSPVVSAMIHMMGFSPTAYTFSAEDDTAALAILRKGLTQPDNTIKMAVLRSLAGHARIVTFPGGEDPFPDAVKTEKTLTEEH